MWRGCLSDGAHWPVRANPFTRRMRQNRAQPDNASTLVNRGNLHRGDLMLAQGLADDVEPARQRGITESLFSPTLPIRTNGPDQRFFWVDEMRLGLSQCRSDRTDRLARPLHDDPPPPEGRS